MQQPQQQQHYGKEKRRSVATYCTMIHAWILHCIVYENAKKEFNKQKFFRYQHHSVWRQIMDIEWESEIESVKPLPPPPPLDRNENKPASRLANRNANLKYQSANSRPSINRAVMKLYFRVNRMR
jgi:hypothetical protein